MPTPEREGVLVIAVAVVAPAFFVILPLAEAEAGQFFVRMVDTIYATFCGTIDLLDVWRQRTAGGRTAESGGARS